MVGLCQVGQPVSGEMSLADSTGIGTNEGLCLLKGNLCYQSTRLGIRCWCVRKQPSPSARHKWEPGDIITFFPLSAAEFLGHGLC